MTQPGMKPLERDVHRPRFWKKKQSDLDIQETKEIRKKIMKLAGPSLTENMLMNALQMVLMMMVGRVGAEAVTVVGLTNQPVFFALAIFMALNVGTTAIVARSIGAGDREQANRAAQQTFLLNIILSGIVVVTTYMFARPILQWMGAEPAVIEVGLGYAQVTFLSLGFTIFSMSLSAVLRGAGDTRTPMKVNIVSSIVVVVLGFPLIYGLFGLPGLGVIGAAIANAVAKLLSAVWMIYALFNGKLAIHLSLKRLWKFDSAMVTRIARIGMPSAGEQFAMRVGQFIFTIVLASLGTAVFAAHTIAFNILGLSFMPGLAFSIAASTMVGQGLGANQPEMASRYGRETERLGNLFSGAMGLIFLLFAPYIMMLYTTDPVVIAQGAIALRIIGFVQIPQSSQFILAGALRGAGDTRFPLYSTLVGVMVVRSVLCVLFVHGFHWGIAGAYLSIVVDQLVRTVIIMYRYRSGKWKLAKV